MQSNVDPAPRPGLHVAIIMDGNGRWAERRGLARSAGHLAGAEAVRRIVRAAVEQGIATLTLFAFSAHNWRRPAPETASLLALLERHLADTLDECVAHGVRVGAIGRRDRLPASLLRTLERVEAETAGGHRLSLRLAIDYSGRQSIVAAARRFNLLAAANGAADGFARLLAPRESPPARDVDLLIRTGGERRLSDFLLWECAQAELLFLEAPWPEADAALLAEALDAFHARDRRYGGLGAS